MSLFAFSFQPRFLAVAFSEFLFHENRHVFLVLLKIVIFSKHRKQNGIKFPDVSFCFIFAHITFVVARTHYIKCMPHVTTFPSQLPETS